MVFHQGIALMLEYSVGQPGVYSTQVSSDPGHKDRVDGASSTRVEVTK